ncbi:LysR family transcriptional regulator [Paralimibaculum aggregatum]|uniref:LysR family transcriptional regulator n=1 Tax=Paralimibaculum aggregatum TaxID=3036245 RepID=A0ABQ6LH55_9RHOB|nr:LysR family transcriptional regulator [Limibaculum sp. NKW23]GMG82622.1 LysR family transcriptional regulator [Limibaculum sp. NKW23]
MDLSSQMVLFAKVMEHGSFSAAARTLGQTPSALSRQIANLEDRLGVRLLHRTRHGLTVTEAGAGFLERSRDVAARVAEAEAETVGLGTRPVGLLRIGSTVAFGRMHLVAALPEFARRHPDLDISLELSDRPIDIEADGIDVAIRFSEQIADQSVVARRLTANPRVICAAPAYLERFGRPATPEALADHNCLRLSTVESWNAWEFGSGAGQTTVVATGSFEANSADAIHQAVLAGMGIARLPTYLVAEDLRRGRLEHLLPGLVDDTTNIVAVYADRRNLPAKIRVFLDHLVERFAGTPPWEAAGGAAGA